MKLLRVPAFALLLPLLLAAGPTWPGPSLYAVALFADKAMLEIDGKQRMLSKGQVSPEGVKLLEASSSRALVEVDGKQLSLSPQARISANFAPPQAREYRIIKDSSGHFRSSGQINGQSINFLVDTGATSISLSEAQAQKLGLSYKSAKTGQVQTAAGVVKGYAITLSEVSLGGLSLRNVPATVIEGNAGSEALLGMSFLKNLEIHQESNLMLLKQKSP